jgi:GNAT superfamily N-acetyltransferase
VRHDFQKLYIMQEVAPHILAKEGDMVIAYALAMDRVFGTKIPELQAMFSILDSLKFRERNVNKINYVVMGQICVHVDYRGQGVFENLYNYFFNYYQSRYDAVITEIAERNVRSLQAHKKVGFEIIHTYEEKGIEDWVIVAKDITI